jgi:hypothetical protein
MAKKSLADEVEAGLKPRKCQRCDAEFTLLSRTEPDTCRFDDFCMKCTIRACLNCMLCVGRTDWKIALRALRDFLNELKLEE